jgi:predicted transcriptional regulator
MSLPLVSNFTFLENEVYSNGEESTNKKYFILKIITHIPGIRYRDLLRVTKFNNGTLSYHLLTLEKRSMIKTLRSKGGHITRYYPYLFPIDEAHTLGYLRIKTTRQILMLLYSKGRISFSEIVAHLNKAPSTTSWNLKRLVEADIITKRKNSESSEYLLKNPRLVEKLVNHDRVAIFLDASADNYISLIEACNKQQIEKWI